MRMSHLVSKTRKEVIQSDPSRNAQLLTRAGYVQRLMSGTYSYLPLGKLVLDNIENIVRQEMEEIGSQEVLLPALHPKENWEKTGRWDSVDVLYKLKGHGDAEFALGASHEEIVTPLIASFVTSYRDLPTQVHQVQTKFRNEKRAKSGLLRGREFRMKDMYSFHANDDDLDAFYEKAIHAYNQVFNRCGLGEITLLTYAAGGTFSKGFSHEFQAITPYGEDIIYRLPGTKLAINKEIIDDQKALIEFIPDYYPGKEKELEELKGIEVGNIFKSGDIFTHPFGATYTDKEGNERDIVSGCFGLGTSRLMGAIAECLSDDRGLVWSEEIAPFHIQLTSLGRSDSDILTCDRVYEELTRMGAKVLYDDRRDLSAGNKLADADLLGMPHRIVISPRTIAENVVEWTKRDSGETQLLSLDEFKVKFMQNKSLKPTLTSLNRSRESQRNL